MSKRKPKLGATSQKLLDAFAAAAKDWGWQEDQGSNDDRIKASHDAYKATAAALVKRLTYLEQALRRAKNPRPLSGCVGCEAPDGTEHAPDCPVRIGPEEMAMLVKNGTVRED